ncbi:antibiotic biosynthesis monooxygenase family protein [Halomonas caseinilytica]|uniref:Heme-degrading monooxygenase HmoA n=1 Tax=Halomonas caseinilytica TaxID=438744 RepID=A0A1M7AKH4_9GAMM|nr:antibiotic biosynthesis monooxygenase [Halomonas caseinilytica]SEN59578.1 Heme-degrading monooxygenase HmoA [Halomonas caseinilytica]SHL43157.1 Heme-degrading monooxygenase HmoA [Halomonas caseinilytica]
MLADTPEPPYYAVIFSSRRSDVATGYDETAARMMHLAAEQPGFLGVESAREAIGITVSYWADLESIKRWKAQAEHREAQRMGRETWYANYRVRIARVERAYGFDTDP